MIYLGISVLNVLLLTIAPSAALGTLPLPHLLTSVSLAAGSQAAAPILTLAQHQSMTPGSATSTDPPQVNQVLPQPPQPTPTAGLVLSSAAEPFPRRLVDKVKSGQSVEMRELLADNISLLHQLEAIQGLPPLQVLGAT